MTKAGLMIWLGITLVPTLTLLSEPAHAQRRKVQLTWVDRTGAEIETIGAPAGYNGPDLSPDGHRLAVHRNDGGGGNVWIFEPGSDTGSAITSNPDGDVNNSMPIWSPDGTRVVYGAARDGRFGLYEQRVDGTRDERLLIESQDRVLPMSWSPDGEFIVYWEPGPTLWALPLTGDRTPFELMDGPSSHGQISPDGNWIAYNTFETGRMEVFVRAFPTGSEAWQVSTDGGTFPRWRGDGGELYFMSQTSFGQIMAAEIRTSGASVETGTPRPLFDSGYNNAAGGVSLGHWHTYAVSPDGARFLIPKPEPDTLVVTDREGAVVTGALDRGIYTGAMFSPDRSRVAVIKQNRDVWVLDAATGEGVRVTSHDRGVLGGLAWSPDGRELAYLLRQDGSEGLYRTAANGEGGEELVYRIPGFGTFLADWTPDGRYLVYFSPQLGGNLLLALPLSGEREPIEIARSDSSLVGPRVSPDGRYMAYVSNETERDEIWVRAFAPSGIADTGPVRVSTDGGVGMVSWREDGRELYYLDPDQNVMAVNVDTSGLFEFSTPRTLFTAPDGVPTNGAMGRFSTDGEQVIFSVGPTPLEPPAPQVQQVVMFDREGQVIETIGEPGRYFLPSLSPDGTRVAVVREDPETEQIDIWSIDVATGRATQVTDDADPKRDPIFSPDGNRILYAALRAGGYPGIYSKAWDGSGEEELLFRYLPGYPVNLSDVSADGQWLTFMSGGIVLVVPLDDDTDPLDREAVELVREEFRARIGRFSPDGRFIAYLSDESGEEEVYVRRFDASAPADNPDTWKVSDDGVVGMLSWREDGEELYYLNGDLEVVAVDVSGLPAFRGGTSRLLFEPPGRVADNLGRRSVSSDGQKFVFLVPTEAEGSRPQ